MNSLNQLAAHFHAKTQEEDPRLFAIADYLRFVFRDGSEAFVQVDEERELLQSYVRLLEASRSLAIPLTMIPGTLAEGGTAWVQRHLSCDLVAALVRALPGDSMRTAQLQLAFEGAGGPWACRLRASLRHSAPADVVRRLRSEVDSLVQRFGLEAGALPAQEISLDQDTLHWTVRLPRTGDAS